eukprot:Colp12_sorted_trinity150504_noHs@23829
MFRTPSPARPLSESSMRSSTPIHSGSSPAVILESSLATSSTATAVGMRLNPQTILPPIGSRSQSREDNAADSGSDVEYDPESPEEDINMSGSSGSRDEHEAETYGEDAMSLGGEQTNGMAPQPPRSGRGGKKYVRRVHLQKPGSSHSRTLPFTQMTEREGSMDRQPLTPAL